MNKNRLLIGLSAILLLLAALAGAFLFWRYFENRQNQKENAQNAKAEEITLTIIEGWGVLDIGNYLEKQGLLPARDFLTLIKDFDLSAYGDALPKNAPTAGLEGFLFPDTYRVPKPGNVFAKDGKESAEILVGKMLQNFTAKVNLEMRAEADKQGRSLYEILTLASIVEKETGRNAVTREQKQKLDAERKIVAGIFLNRLNIGMPLESDATINYITKKNNPQPTAADLEVSSPYNTYQNKGLPPGPICNPSLSSILAALYPTENDYLYFLHKQPSGEAVFSKTYEEHLQNKYKYLR